MPLSPLVRFGTSTWTYEGWQGQIYVRQYAKSKFARVWEEITIPSYANQTHYGTRADQPNKLCEFRKISGSQFQQRHFNNRFFRRTVSRFDQYDPPYSWCASLAGLPQVIGSLLCHPQIGTASVFHAEPSF